MERVKTNMTPDYYIAASKFGKNIQASKDFITWFIENLAIHNITVPLIL